MMRTGKLKGQTKVLVPYYDTEGQRHFQMITINGDIYASKLYAGIKKFVLDNYGVKVDKDWLHNVPLIVNSNDPEVQIPDEEKQKIVDSFLERMELKDDEDQDSADSGSQSETPPQAGEPLCTVPDQSI